MSRGTDEHRKWQYERDDGSTNLAVTTSPFVIKTAGVSHLLLPFNAGMFYAPDRSHELFTMVSAQPIHNHALQHRSDRSLLSTALRLWDRMAAGGAWGDSLSRGFLAASAPGCLLKRATNIQRFSFGAELSLHQNTAILRAVAGFDRSTSIACDRQLLNKSHQLFPFR